MWFRCRVILERFLVQHPKVGSFLKFSKWEEEKSNYVRARAGFEKALEVLPADELSENFFLKVILLAVCVLVCVFAELCVYVYVCSFVCSVRLDVCFIRLQFARFEENRRSKDRAKAVYLEGLRRLGPSSAVALQNAYISFEKRLGDNSE